MSVKVFGPQAVVTALNRALFNTSPSNEIFSNQVAQAGTSATAQDAFANDFVSANAPKGTDGKIDPVALMKLALANVGFVDAAGDPTAKDLAAAFFGADVPQSGYGAQLLFLLNLLSDAESNAVLGPFALAWNDEVTSSFKYSEDVNHTTPFTGDFNLDTTAPVVTAQAAPFSYAENQASGFTVGTVAATDNIKVTDFKIVSGDTAGLFTIDATGKITLTAASVGATIDANPGSNNFEVTPHTFTLGVQALDAAGNKSATADVVINVTDVDDVAPGLVATTSSGTIVKLNFNEALKDVPNLGGAAFVVTDASNANISIDKVQVSGTSVTLTLRSAPSGTVKVSYTPPANAADALQDSTGNKVVAITGQVALTDVTAPTLVTTVPGDNSTGILTTASIVMTFNESVSLGSGNITIVNSADANDKITIAATDAGQVTVSGKVVTIKPTNALKTGTSYYVNVPNTAVLDLAGNAFAGISGTTAFDFTTSATTGVTGQTYVLTKAVEDFNLTNNKASADNDTYIASIDSSNAESNTLNTGDVVDGNAGTDTLNLTRATDNWPVVQLKNIEILQVKNVAALTNLLDLSVFDAALAQVQSVGSSASTTFSNAKAGLELTVKDVATTGLTTRVQYTAGQLTGSSDSVKLNLNNVTSVSGTSHTIQLVGAAASQGIENLAVATSSSNSQLAALTVQDGAAADTLKKLTVTGDKNLSITAALQFAGATGTGEVDAQGFAGNLTLNLDNGDDVTVTGGSGNDSFAFGASLTSTDKIDGNGGKDTLGANTFALLEAAFNASRVSNIEVLRIQSAIATTGTLDTSKAGSISEVVLSGGVNAAVNATFDKLAADATFTISVASPGTVTANLKDATLAGTANALTLNLGSSTDGAGIAAGTVTAAGVETVNIFVAGTGASTNTLTLTGNSDLQKVAVTGEEALTLTFAGGSAALKEYDASAATGVQNTTSIDFSNSGATIKGGNKADTLIGDGGNDSIVGNAGNDSLTGAAGSDVLTGGDGSDTFLVSDNGNAVNLTNPITDTIKDFTLGSGGDVLDITALGVRPTIDGAMSAVKVTALNGALPATGGTDGRAELVILDSTVTDMQASNASGLNAKLFNLSSAGYTNIVVAYADSASGNTRLASATFAGTDIGSVTDFAVLEGVTTAALASGFNAVNITGAGAAGGSLVASAAAFNSTTGVNITGGTTIVVGANNTITSTGAFTAASTITGSTGTDTLVISDGNAVDMSTNGAVVTSIDAITLNTAHAGFVPFTQAVAITGSTGVDNVTINTTGQSYNAVSGADVVTITGAPTGVTLTNLTGTVKLAATGSIAGVNSGAVTGAATLDLTTVATINATMTAAQHNGFTAAINANAGDDTITLTTAGTIATDADIGTYSVVEGSVVTVGPAATHAAQILAETGAVGTVSTFTLGTGTYTGIWTGIDATDVVKIVTGTNVAGNTGLNAGAVIDFQSATAAVTLNATQNGVVTYANAGTGTQTVTLSAADTFTTDAVIEAYSGIGGGTITLAAGHTGVLLTMDNTAATTVLIGGQTVATAAGGYALAHAADVISATTGANIAGINAGAATTAESLTLTGGTGAAVTMTQAQWAGLTGTITAAGTTDSITLTTAGTVNLTTTASNNAIESWTLGSNAANTFTFSAIPTNAAQTVNTSGSFAGQDVINATMPNAGSTLYTVNLNTDAQTDRIAITNTSLQVGNGSATNAIVINGFAVANDAISLTDTGVGSSISNAGFQAIAAGGQVALVNGVKSVIEITGTNIADLYDDADGGAAELAVLAGVGTTAAAGNYTVVIYSGANAGIYDLNIAVANTTVVAADITLELIGVVNGVTMDALGSGNFS